MISGAPHCSPGHILLLLPNLEKMLLTSCRAPTCAVCKSRSLLPYSTNNARWNFEISSLSATDSNLPSIFESNSTCLLLKSSIFLFNSCVLPNFFRTVDNYIFISSLKLLTLLEKLINSGLSTNTSLESLNLIKIFSNLIIFFFIISHFSIIIQFFACHFIG